MQHACLAIVGNEEAYLVAFILCLEGCDGVYGFSLCIGLGNQVAGNSLVVGSCLDGGGTSYLEVGSQCGDVTVVWCGVTAIRGVIYRGAV